MRCVPRPLYLAALVCWALAWPSTIASDPWDEPSWVPQGGGFSGPPFPALNSTAAPGLCLRNAQSFVSSMDHLPSWALRLLASSSEVRDGLAGAFPPPLADFEGCPSFSPSSDYLNIVGKYCVANITLIGPSEYAANASAHGYYLVKPLEVVENYLLAFCAEASCSSGGLSDAVQDFFNRSMATDGDRAKTIVNHFECKTWRREQQMHGPEIAVLFFLVMFGVIVIVGTCYEGFARLKQEEKTGVGSRILLSFSLLTNVPKLIAVTSNDSTMNFLFGLKFFSICWVVFGHTLYSTAIMPLTNPEYVVQFPKHWIRMLVLNESVAVDTFLLISGLLLAIVFLRERDSGVAFNPVLFYLHRILRLTPPYAIVVFFYATLFYRLGSGPAWDALVGYNAKTCRLNWWTNLLYVNNYVNIDQPCMDHSWYLAVDTQLYFVSPVVLFLMHKYRLFRLFLLPILVAAAVIVPFGITAVMKLQAAMFFFSSTPEEVTGVFSNVYTRAYARAGPYLVGIGLGFFIHKYRGRQLLLPKYAVVLGWSLSTAALLAVIFGVYGFMQPDHVYNVWESAIYAGFHRTVWALGVAWIILACSYGYAGPVNSILSWKLLTPLGRLTYCIYLIHYVVIMYFTGSVRTRVYFSVNEVVRNFLGNLVIAIVISLGLSLSFESPFIGISKAFIKRDLGARRAVALGKQPEADSAPQVKKSAPQSRPGTSPDQRRFSDVEHGSNEEVRHLDDRSSNLKHAYSNEAYEATP